MAAASSPSMPAWIAALLARPWLWPLARTALVSSYAIGGVDKLAHFHAAIQEQAHFGLHPAWLWAALAVAVELGGSLCVILGRLTWLGAGGLGCLTAVAMVVANDFWNLAGQERFVALNTFFEHLGLIAGLLGAVVLDAARRSSGPAPRSVHSH